MSNVRQVKTAGELIPGRQLLQQVSRSMAPEEVCRQGCSPNSARLACDWPCGTSQYQALRVLHESKAARLMQTDLHVHAHVSHHLCPNPALKGPAAPHNTPPPQTMQHACL